MAIPLDVNEAIDISLSAHCWAMVRSDHEVALRALVNAVASGSPFLYTPVDEIHLPGLSMEQILRLTEGHDGIIYHDSHGAVIILEDLWEEVEAIVAQTAPNAFVEHMVAVNLSFSDPHAVDKLRIELKLHPALNYAEVEFGED